MKTIWEMTIMGTDGPKFEKQRHRLTRKSERDQELKQVRQDDCIWDGDWRLGEGVYGGDKSCNTEE
jgi:hypothetical protein